MLRPRRRYPVSCHPVAPDDLTVEDFAYITALVEDVRSDAGAGGQCSFVVDVLAHDFGWMGMGGFYHSPDGRVVGDHVWALHEPTNTIIDATADQFGEGAAIRILSATDPLAARYKQPWDEAEDDAWWDAAGQNRNAEGEWWWVPEGPASAHVVAYEHNVARWSDLSH